MELTSLAHPFYLRYWKQFQREGRRSCHEETPEQHQESINN